MKTTPILFTVSALALLTACGGGGGAGATDDNGIQTAPLSGAEIESTFNSVASAAGGGITVDELASVGNAAAAIDFDTLEARDLTAPGSATYTGVVVLADLDTSGGLNLLVSGDSAEDFLGEDTPDPTFAMLGRSQLRVTFGQEPEFLVAPTVSSA